MIIIDGKKIAAEILEKLKSQSTPTKFLAGILIGDDPASVSFQKIKERTAHELGVDYRIYKFSSEFGNDKLRREVGTIGLQKSCGGVIVQLPLPNNLNAQYIVNAIPPKKDVDVLGERALGAFYAGRSMVLPPAVGVVEEIVQHEKIDLGTQTVAVVGLGFLVGRPIATWLMRKCKNLFLLRRGSDFELLKRADIVISGAGSPGILRPDMLKNDALVIDFGYDRSSDGKLVGDFNSDFNDLRYAICDLRFTPTPGGTGPILVAKLFENFYRLTGGK